MLTYTVICEKGQVVQGLGVFREGDRRQLKEADVDWFERVRGIKLLQDNLPEGMLLEIAVTGSDEDEEVND